MSPPIPLTHPRGELPTPEEFARVLHARGQRATPQRYAILRELRERGQHATAEEIGRAVRARMPGTSTPTVYATLDLLVGLGLVRRIDTGHGASVYDGGTEPHHHMVCRGCGAVTDLPGELDAARWLDAAGATGFRPEGAELVVSGLCPSCAPAS
ncbi:MAG TPA: transcriptional repressor [Solirubrobacteraceae bacterium]|nr:transcriptional repressor [Solirubrobacteraceae bacterium]